MTSIGQPTPPQTPPPRRLTRSSTDKMVGGVSGGLGRYFDVDPILFRIGFVVAALAGGAGLLAYVALWVFVADETGKGFERPEGRNVLAVVGVSAAALIFVSLLPGPDFFIWPGFLGVAALGLLIAVLAGSDRGAARGGAGRILLVAGGIVLAAVAGVSAAVGTAFGGGAVVSVIVILCGLGLIAGAFSPGRRWLLVPALVLAAPAAIVEAADVRVTGGVGEREYRPTSVTEMRDVYRLGVGDLYVDLSDVDFPAGRTSVRIELGMGEARVIVPDDVCVSSRAQIGGGVSQVFGRENGGFDVDWTQAPRNESGAPELFVDGDVDFGALHIMRLSQLPGDRHDDRGPFRTRDDYGLSAVPQEACTA